MPSSPSGPFSVAFVCAMPMELRPLVKRLRLRRSRIGDGASHLARDRGSVIYAGTASGRPALAIATGMGTALATASTRGLLDRVEVGHVVVFGIAGAVGESITPGTIIRPQAVIDAGTGTTHVPAPRGDADPRGAIWTTDTLITDPDVVGGLRSRGVLALDMETAAIAAVCERHRVGWSVVRVISDRAADGIVTEEVFRLNKPDGTPDLAAVARYFIRHPGHVRRMARLAASARNATATAADAAISAWTHGPHGTHGTHGPHGTQ